MGPVLTALRTATRAVHARLERQADPRALLATSTGRQLLVQRYYALHVPAEHRLAPWLRRIPGLAFAERRRAPLLLEALANLKMPRPASCAHMLAPMLGQGEALGFFYVLEGSSLGGRVILRDLVRRGIDPAGLAFLDPYGSVAGERWSAFVGVLEREAGDEGGREAMVAGALKGFAHAEACLAGDLVAA